jgi:hypothetical protein
MTRRRRESLLNRGGRAASLSVQLSYIARHFQTGEQLRIARLAPRGC